VPAYVAFGANLGDPPATYRAVQERLRQSPDVESCRSSPLYRTTPVGGPPGQPSYFNGAIEVQTPLGPEELHGLLARIQRELGRPEQSHWQPRTIDLDLILFDDRIVVAPDLVVPHPRAHHRWFVLRPIVDLCPLAMHPVLNRSAAQLLSFLEASRPKIVVVGGSGRELDLIRDRIWKQFTSSAPEVLHCPVPSREVDFLGLAGKVVGTAFQHLALGPDVVQTDRIESRDRSIWIFVLRDAEPRRQTTSTPAWPSVDLRADSIDDSLRQLDFFLESRLPGRPVETSQE
jgi:2-amino-4-hydroxy-6-hydroxymethyldihydropteridine diphosphokinase